MGGNFGIDEEIAQAAARQYGNITRQQLRAAGLKDVAINYRVKLGRLHRVHRGVYAVGYPPVTPLEHAMAAVLACGPGGALGRGSAMTLWGFWKRWDRPFEVVTAGDRRPPGIRVHRSRTLHRRDISRQLGIPVTTPARTLLDMALRLSPRSLRRAVKDGQASKVLSLDALEDLLARLPYHPGAPRLKPFLDDPDDTRSGLEDRFVDFCRRHGLPRPEINVKVCGFEVDALFPEEKVIVELDSWGFHSNRESFEDDRKRDAIMLAAGYESLRITWRRLQADEAHEAELLHRVLAARRRRIDSPPA